MVLVHSQLAESESIAFCTVTLAAWQSADSGMLFTSFRKAAKASEASPLAWRLGSRGPSKVLVSNWVAG